jgi:hypothetical protein
VRDELARRKRLFRRSLLLALAALMLGASPAARADSNLFVGVDENALKSHPSDAVAVASDLGMTAFLITLDWYYGQTNLTEKDRAALQTALDGRAGMRVVLSVYGTFTPVDPAARDQYCTYVRNVIEEFPALNDIVIWNEPNLPFWNPQFNFDGSSAAPAAYEALLAQCYDLLHAARPGINVIAPATSSWGNDNPLATENVSHSPVNFIRELGVAYRASGRNRPIFDTFGHHPYPTDSSERPWKQHPGTQVSQGDLGKLVDAIRNAFTGTAQPVPGNGLSIWYLEDGYQTTIPPDKQRIYTGLENWRHSIPDYIGGEPDYPTPSADSPAPDQATQLRDAIRLAYCQPYVDAFFNFLLWDESEMTGWQSGLLWADGTPKASYAPVRQAIREVDQRTVDCGQVKGAPAAASTANGGGGHQAQSGRRRTLIRYTGTRIGPFGFVVLRARLTRAVDGKPLARRKIVFRIGGRRAVTRSDRRGTATAPKGLPLSLGGNYLRVRFAGDRLYRAAWAKLKINVRNSPATVRTKGSLRLPHGAYAAFRVRSAGRQVRGTFRFKSAAVVVDAARLDALGLGPGRRSAWFAGRGTRGATFFAFVRKLRHGGVRFQVWVSGSSRNAHGRVLAGGVVLNGDRLAVRGR